MSILDWFEQQELRFKRWLRRQMIEAALELLKVALHLGAVALAAGALYGTLQGFKYLSQRWQAPQLPLADIAASCTVALSVLAVGGLLFLLREKQRTIYAYLEIGVAMAASIEAYMRLMPSASYSAFAFAVSASVYIAVRGYDNLSIASKNRERRSPTM